MASSSATTDEAEKSSWVSTPMATPSRSRQRHARLEYPGRGPELFLAFRRVGGQRTAEHADQRGFPVTGQLEEPAQVGAWIVTGQADGTVYRDDRQPGRGCSPPDLGAGGGGHPRVDELAVDEPQLDAGVAPAAAE